NGSTENITQVVKEKYGAAALLVQQARGNACGGSTPSSTACCDPITNNLYDTSETELLPEDAVKASLGCGNPTALAQLHAGESVLLWVGCVAGALEENDYRGKLTAVGFEQIEVQPTRIYRTEDAREFLTSKGIDVDALAPHIDGKFLRAFIHAVKP